MMRTLLIVAGLALVLLGLGAAALGLTIWNSAIELAPDRMQGHPVWVSAELYALFAVTFLALGLLCFALAEVLYRLPR